MSDSNLFSDRLREPLNETTRKIRRNLLAVSIVGVVIAKVGLIPSKISAFGIEFSTSNQEALIMLLGWVILYYCFAFIVYLYSELIAWRLVFLSKELAKLKCEPENITKATDYLIHEDARRAYLKAKPIFFIRIFVELAIPIIFAIYSYIALFNLKP